MIRHSIYSKQFLYPLDTKSALTYNRITVSDDADKELLSGTGDDILRPVDIQVSDTIEKTLMNGSDTDNLNLSDLVGDGFLVVTQIEENK